jgi:hypothetical protein
MNGAGQWEDSHSVRKAIPAPGLQSTGGRLQNQLYLQVRHPNGVVEDGDVTAFPTVTNNVQQVTSTSRQRGPTRYESAVCLSLSKLRERPAGLVRDKTSRWLCPMRKTSALNRPAVRTQTTTMIKGQPFELALRLCRTP